METANQRARSPEITVPGVGDALKRQVESLEKLSGLRIPDLGEADRRVRRLVREQPLLALAVAVATGYVVGRVVARS